MIQLQMIMTDEVFKFTKIILSPIRFNNFYALRGGEMSAVFSFIFNFVLSHSHRCMLRVKKNFSISFVIANSISLEAILRLINLNLTPRS